MYDICCIGPITLDKIVTPGRVVEMAGGTAFYFSNAYRNMELQYVLITTIAATEKEQLDEEGFCRTEFTYLLTREQKEKSGGYDVIIQYRCKMDLPLNFLIAAPNKDK